MELKRHQVSSHLPMASLANLKDFGGAVTVRVRLVAKWPNRPIRIKEPVDPRMVHL